MINTELTHFIPGPVKKKMAFIKYGSPGRTVLFATTYRLAPIQLNMQWVLWAIFLGVNRWECEANH
jgi:hypothetical protein